MREIKTEIKIAAPAKTIWKVLMDFDNYSKWNPFIKSIEGEQEVGKQLKVSIQPPEGREMTFKPNIQVVEPNSELRWLGKGPIGGLFDGQHSFVLDEQEDGTTRFVHSEKFRGILVGLMGKTLDKTEIGFRQMNEALKKECENKNHF